ncbi:MAG TPA: hypothetical protein VLD39_02580 [Gammaproteobacteria bacterium]|nr:hypothetical protein [Gammaproteobacteria bacterium]
MTKRVQISLGLRDQIAEEAARLIRDHGIQDYGFAKRKAAARFGVANAGALPSNTEVEARVLERQRIFEGDEHLTELRQIAVGLMGLLDGFSPRLAGPVLTGAATINSGIELHLFTDCPEDVFVVLERERFPVRNCQRRYRYHGHGTVIVPGFRFAARGADIYALTFPENGLRQAPMSPIDGRPMRRADRAKVLALLETS